MQKALSEMTQQEAHGGKKVVGDYLVAWANEKAEGLYFLRDGNLEWHEPEEENTHLEVAVCDARDGRFIPGLKVHATLLDKDGTQVGSHVQPFLWHSWLLHYGRNWKVPHAGPYTLRIHIEPAAFPRHDKVNGKRFAEPVEAEFTDIKLDLGQK